MTLEPIRHLSTGISPLTKLLATIIAIVLLLALAGLAFLVHEIDMFIIEQRSSSSGMTIGGG